MRASIFAQLDEFLALNLSSTKLIRIGLSVLLGVGMGFLISREMWMYAVIMALLIPFIILLIKRPFFGVIFYLLLMPLSSAFPNVGMMYLFIHRLLLPITLAAIIVSYLLKTIDYQPSRLGLPEIALFILVAYIPISIIYSQVDLQAPLRNYIDRMLIPFCMYLLVRLISLDKRNLQILYWTAFVVSVIQCMIGILSWVMPQLLPLAWHHLIGARTAGSLLDPAVFTSILVFCATLLFYAAMHQNPGLVRFLFLMACGASFICIFISLERGSWLAGLFVLLGLLVLYPKPMLRFLLVAGVVMLILGMGFFSQQVTLATQRLGERGPIDARIVVTDAMFQMIKLKPAFGWGYDTLNQNIAQYYRHVGAASIDLVFTTSHNTYLTILTELGIIGFLLYMLPVIWLLLKSFVVYKHSFNRTFKYNLLIAVFWLGALQNFIVSNFMDMRFFPIGLTLWWLSMGLIANLLNQYEETQTAQVHHRVRGNMLRNRSFDEQLLGHSET